MSQVFKEAFLYVVQEQLYAGSEFVKFATSHDAYIEYNKVHVPQAGTLPGVQVNRQQLPAQVSERLDADLAYTLDEYTMDPVIIRDIEKLQLSYPKIQSVLQANMDALNNEIGARAAHDWAGTYTTDPTTNQVFQTTGTSTLGIAPDGCTGTRKAVKIADIALLAAKMDHDNVPREGRFLLMPSVMYWSMIQENTNLGSSLYDPSPEARIAYGATKMIYDFNIIRRSYTCTYAITALTLNAVGAAVVATDKYAAVGWQKDCVAKAQGPIKYLSQIESPTYYADMYSALMMFKATPLRSDGKGIATLVQGE